MLLQVDADLAQEFNNYGYTTLHLAAMNGKTAILEEFTSMAPTKIDRNSLQWQDCNYQYYTKNGENVFHLTVRYNHYDAFLYLVHIFNDTDIFHCPDQYGNTILHIAASGGHHQVRNENDICCIIHS